MTRLTSPSPGGLIALTWVLTILAFTTLTARFFTRLRGRQRLLTDDVFALAAGLAFVAVYSVPVTVGATKGGLGSHTKFAGNGQREPPNSTLTHVRFVTLNFNPWVVGLARLSILFLYRRIFRGKAFKIAVWTVIAYTVAWIISFFLTILLRCIPFTFDVRSLPGSKCIALVPVTYTLGISSAINDLLILLLPWPWMFDLQMHKKQKIAVSAIFLLGGLTLTMSIVRTVMIWEMGIEMAGGDADFTYFDGAIIIWAMLESAMAIICACLPTLGRYVHDGISDVPVNLTCASSEPKSFFSRETARRLLQRSRFGSLKSQSGNTIQGLSPSQRPGRVPYANRHGSANTNRTAVAGLDESKASMGLGTDLDEKLAMKLDMKLGMDHGLRDLDTLVQYKDHGDCEKYSMHVNKPRALMTRDSVFSATTTTTSASSVSGSGSGHASRHATTSSDRSAVGSDQEQERIYRSRNVETGNRRTNRNRSNRDRSGTDRDRDSKNSIMSQARTIFQSMSTSTSQLDTTQPQPPLQRDGSGQTDGPQPQQETFSTDIVVTRDVEVRRDIEIEAPKVEKGRGRDRDRRLKSIASSPTIGAVPKGSPAGWEEF